MKHRTGTLLFLLSVFVAAAAFPARACGDGDAEHVAQFHKKKSSQSCCKKDDAPAHCSENAGACNETHPGQPCSDDDGCGTCHCPGCGVVTTAGGALLIEPPAVLPSLCESDRARRQAFYFAEHIPEAVYLPIWQPPKIRD
ncbi:MAG: hypothetical protein ABMA02_14715 [Saprospiraceae bacterium]